MQSLYRLAKRRHFIQEDVEDLVQTTWLRAFSKNQQDNPKYLMGVLINVSQNMYRSKVINTNNITSVYNAYYSQDNDMRSAHLKGDIIKCLGLLNKKQQNIIKTMYDNPEASHAEWAEELGMDRRNLTYHILNIRAIFKSMMEENSLPGKSYDHLKGLT